MSAQFTHCGISINHNKDTFQQQYINSQNKSFLKFSFTTIQNTDIEHLPLCIFSYRCIYPSFVMNNIACTVHLTTVCYRFRHSTLGINSIITFHLEFGENSSKRS